MNKKKCGNCKALEEHTTYRFLYKCCIYGELEHLDSFKYMGTTIHQPLRHKDCTKQCRTNMDVVNRQKEKYESQHE